LGAFLDIDKIVKIYPAYNHDQVFYLEYEFCMNLLYLHKEELEYRKRYENIWRALNEKPTKNK